MQEREFGNRTLCQQPNAGGLAMFTLLMIPRACCITVWAVYAAFETAAG